MKFEAKEAHMSSIASHDNSKIPYLDGWRGLAIILVLSFHFLGAPFDHIGAFGVFLFFALSGLFMGQMLFVRKMDLTTFFVRRFSRVVPTFWLFTACMIVYAATLQPARYDTPPGEILSTLLFLRTYFPTDMGIWSGKLPTGHFWSLNVEEHSYAFLALGAFLFNRSTKKNMPLVFLITSSTVVLAIHIVYLISPPESASPWFVRTEAASIGLLASATYCLFKERTPIPVLTRLPGWIPVLAFFIAAALFMSANNVLILASMFFLAFTVNHLDTAPELCKRMLSTSVMRSFGKYSFSIYLWQQPFYALTYIYPEYRYALLLAALATGCISFYCFENPVREAINHAWDKHRKVAPQIRESLANNSSAI
jgi:peptidoglycan/LPS O-acetylase OafA/YrhL